MVMNEGTVLDGRYRLDERVGAGGMGEVWRATDEVLRRRVAIKIVLPALVGQPGFVRRFLVEARAMASVRHPGVVAIHDFRGDDDAAYLVMEYVDGEPLSRRLARVVRLDPAVAMEVVRQAALALEAVHRRSIVHRDVKAANLLLRADGSVALTDFGIALPPEASVVTTTGAVLGTPSYLAPEQVLGRPATPRSDVYALGVVAYECVAGRRPFVGDNPFAVAMQRVREPAPPLGPPVPPAVAAVIGRALATEPEQRWATAADLAEAAARAGTAPLGEETTVPLTVHKRRLPVVVGAVVLAVLLGVAAVAVGPRLWRSGPVETAGGPRGTAGGLRGTAGPSSSGGGSVDGVPAGPLCWFGLNIDGGILGPLHRASCDEPHYWETFAVAPMPAGAAGIREDTLMSVAPVAAICSPEAAAKASREAAMSDGWRRDGVPYTTTAGRTVLMCIAGHGETTGSVFLLGQ
jgi:serine/threonine-protein kinase